MQAIMVSEFGGPEVLEVRETDIPVPGPGEVLVRVLAAGVGPWDAQLRRGGQNRPLPYVPGGEFAGVVEGDSGDQFGFRDGDHWPSDVADAQARAVERIFADRLAAVVARAEAAEAKVVAVEAWVNRWEELDVSIEHRNVAMTLRAALDPNTETKDE